MHAGQLLDGKDLSMILVLRPWSSIVVVLLTLPKDIDGSFKINKGLRMARQLLSDITHMGVPVGVELLDTISPQFISVSGFSQPSPLALTRPWLIGSSKLGCNR